MGSMGLSVRLVSQPLLKGGEEITLQARLHHLAAHLLDVLSHPTRARPYLPALLLERMLAWKTAVFLK